MSELNSITQQEPIAAIATPAGEGGISVIRVSGRDSVKLTETIFRGPKISKKPSHSIHYGKIEAEDRIIDDVLVSLFHAPKSYTGEETVEISCHGGVLITQLVLETILAAGARAAAPGEFTQRAFLNGKLDLSQAEAVADLIHAKSRKAVESSRQQLDGKLGAHIKQFRQQIIDAVAMVELELDFIEEDVEFASRDQLRKLLDALISEIETLLATYETGRLVMHGVRTVFAGAPNAGKSTLLNTLTGRDRAIVSDVAGTTRDTIDADWSYGGLLFTLTDTAGIRVTGDAIEAEGVRRSEKAIQDADLVVFLLDLSLPNSEDAISQIQKMKASFPEKPFLITGTKSDLAKEQPESFKPDHTISSVTGEGIEDLKEAMKNAVLGSREIDTSGLLVTSSRHRDALQKTKHHVESALNALETGITGDFLAIDLRSALHQLGSITGEITTEDLLDSIFSRFCIGK